MSHLDGCYYKNKVLVILGNKPQHLEEHAADIKPVTPEEWKRIQCGMCRQYNHQLAVLVIPGNKPQYLEERAVEIKHNYDS